MKYVEQFIFCRTLSMNLLKGSTSISYFSSKVEISFYKVEIFNLEVKLTLCKIGTPFHMIKKHIWVHSSRIRSQVYTRDRETQPGCHAPTLSQARDNRHVNPSWVINTFLELAQGFQTPVHTYNSPITGEYHKN